MDDKRDYGSFVCFLLKAVNDANKELTGRFRFVAASATRIYG